ncbi:NlpC/P60 family protein [Skermania sp. ID1734]|uniref:C40 family peptidase n=1 Tax=Skermania sp. ID1734 TaxID=2597516 RepID=UPI00117EFCD4|nr:C40 family peptidase [Skermania sp. ID1734]TSE01193.1 NlpC/P60 family protein [Skermania sp. ID1734]
MASIVTRRPVRRAAVAGAVALGAIVIPAAPALAEPVNVPGVGTFDVPNLPPLPAAPAIPALPGQPPLPFQQAITAGQQALDAARSKLGAPYVYGATGPNAFDCSGLVQWAYRQAGRVLPRTSWEQAAGGTPVALNALQPGDVISYDGGSHSAIYAGDGQVIHASTSGVPVKYAPLYSMPIFAARRY